MNPRSVASTMTCFVLLSLLVGCAAPVDRRVAEDDQTCRSMGHILGTPAYSACRGDLNERRCAVIKTKGALEHHDATMDCTKLR